MHQVGLLKKTGFFNPEYNVNAQLPGQTQLVHGVAMAGRCFVFPVSPKLAKANLQKFGH